MNEPSPRSHRAGPVSWQWSTWRLVISTGVVLALVVVVGVGTFSPHWRVCPGTPGEACRLLGWTDPFVVLVLVLAAVIGFPDISWVKISPEGFEAKREPELLSPNADLEGRVRQLEEGKVPEWRRETDAGGGQEP